MLQQPEACAALQHDRNFELRSVGSVGFKSIVQSRQDGDEGCSSWNGRGKLGLSGARPTPVCMQEQSCAAKYIWQPWVAKGEETP